MLPYEHERNRPHVDRLDYMAFFGGGAKLDSVDPVEKVKLRLLELRLSAAGIRVVIAELQKIDWESLCKERDSKHQEKLEQHQEELEQWLNILVSCPNCSASYPYRDFRSPSVPGRSFYEGPLCAGCAREVEESYFVPCMMCGVQTVITRKGQKHVVCLSCKNQALEQGIETDVYYWEGLKVRFHNNRARQAGTSADLSLEQWMTTLRHFGFQCAYCLGPYEVLEHIIPISDGGSTSRHNCVPACALCNNRKGGKYLDDTMLDTSMVRDWLTR